jgi:hypothetical protein
VIVAIHRFVVVALILKLLVWPGSCWSSRPCACSRPRRRRRAARPARPAPRRQGPGPPARLGPRLGARAAARGDPLPREHHPRGPRHPLPPDRPAVDPRRRHRGPRRQHRRLAPRRPRRRLRQQRDRPALHRRRRRSARSTTAAARVGDPVGRRRHPVGRPRLDNLLDMHDDDGWHEHPRPAGFVRALAPGRDAVWLVTDSLHVLDRRTRRWAMPESVEWPPASPSPPTRRRSSSSGTAGPPAPTASTWTDVTPPDIDDLGRFPEAAIGGGGWRYVYTSGMWRGTLHVRGPDDAGFTPRESARQRHPRPRRRPARRSPRLVRHLGRGRALSPDGGQHLARPRPATASRSAASPSTSPAPRRASPPADPT